jgi:hypothetical protein
MTLPFMGDSPYRTMDPTEQEEEYTIDDLIARLETMPLDAYSSCKPWSSTGRHPRIGESRLHIGTVELPLTFRQKRKLGRVYDRLRKLTKQATSSKYQKLLKKTLEE